MAAASSVLGPGAGAGTLRGKRVLIVEDSWTIAKSLQALLTEHEALVIGPVGSVREALAKIGEYEIDLTLLDLNLREDFADAVVDALLDRDIPYVVVTAYSALPTDAFQFAATVLHKPIDNAEVIEAVRRHSR